MRGGRHNGALLNGVDLRRALLSAAEFRGAQFVGANLSEATLAGSQLRAADRSGARLVKADLRGADLEQAKLSSADITDADFRSTTIGSTDGKDVPTQLNGADLDNVTAVRTPLTLPSLMGATAPTDHFDGATLARAHLKAANLEPAPTTTLHPSGAHNHEDP